MIYRLLSYRKKRKWSGFPFSTKQNQDFAILVNGEALKILQARLLKMWRAFLRYSIFLMEKRVMLTPRTWIEQFKLSGGIYMSQGACLVELSQHQLNQKNVTPSCCFDG